jgi:hypothetical protein
MAVFYDFHAYGNFEKSINATFSCSDPKKTGGHSSVRIFVLSALSQGFIKLLLKCWLIE